MSQTQDQVIDSFKKFESEMSGPYLGKISQLESDNEKLTTELTGIKEKLSQFEHLLPLLERKEEVFQLQIKDSSLLQKAVMVIDQYRLYPKMQRDYLEYKSSGGKRPKDPIRQFLTDLIKVCLERPTLVTGALKSQGNYDMKEGYNSVT